jgi:Zn-dependent protease with chaperone function
MRRLAPFTFVAALGFCLVGHAQDFAYIDCHGGYSKVKVASQPGPVEEKHSGTVKCGEKVLVVGQVNDMSRIEFKGHEGYISSWFLSQTQTHKSAREAELQLPSDYSIDIRLGISSRARYMGSTGEIVDGSARDLGNTVFYKLIAAGFTQPYPWKLTLVNNGVVNAASSAGGQVYVYGGLVNLLGSNPGLWAAVLSHEVSHTGLRHQVRVYLQEEYNEQMITYYRQRVAAGDNSANYALAAYSIASAIALKKMEREQEHAADEKGMLLMARAGYHPDYVFSLHHILRIGTGEQSKFAAFFSGHPRWETRDQRSQREYSEALSEFNRLWPDPASSPGGLPPVVAFLGQPNAREDKQQECSSITVPLQCRNAREPVVVMLRFFDGKNPAASANPDYRDPSGSLMYTTKFECPEAEDKPLTIQIPSSATLNRNLNAQAFVVDTNGNLLEESSHFDVHFPKVK